MTTAPRSQAHAVLVTYRRHRLLEAYLAELSEQTVGFSHLVVVDNEASPDVEGIVGRAAPGAERVSYMAMPENVGPAGGIAAGMERILEDARDDDWIVVLDDDDPPVRPDTLGSVRRLADDARVVDPRAAALGLWGARLGRWTGRLRVATGPYLEKVDYVAGGSYPHYLVGALRRVGTGTPGLFFGFDDLELGLKLTSAGGAVYSSGLAAAHGFGHHVERSRASAVVPEATWRRYYSLRNLVWLLRRFDMIPGALAMGIAAGILKPLVNLPLRPRAARDNLRLNVSALRDGWTGRLGRTVEPVR